LRSLPSDIPPHAVPFVEQMGYLDADPLAAGDPAPDVILYTAAGQPAALRDLLRDRPVVLVFGSYT